MKKIAGIWLYYLVGSILISCSTGQQAEEKVVYLKDYLVGYQEGQDATLALRRALDECKKVKARRLELPAEKLYFQPDYAVEQYVFVSNNDEGLKRFDRFVGYCSRRQRGCPLVFRFCLSIFDPGGGEY